MYQHYLTNLLSAVVGVSSPVILLLILRLVYRSAPAWLCMSLLAVVLGQVFGSLPFVLSRPFFEHSPFYVSPDFVSTYHFPLMVLSYLAHLGLLAVVYAMALKMRRQNRD